MQIKHLSKKILTVGLLGLACWGLGGQDVNARSHYNDGEVFTSTQVMHNAQVLYHTNAYANWVWHGEQGLPTGLRFLVIPNGQKTQTVVTTAQDTKMDEERMLAAAQAKFQGADYAKKLVLYATTGPSAAKTEIAISRVELFGRLLNVTVALQDAELNTPLTMNLIYPETFKTISRSQLPVSGSLRVRFVDMKGHALAVEDIMLTR
ncbi:MAG: hypothetical protein RR384_03040 [Acidaminococcaceae bacterium]